MWLGAGRAERTGLLLAVAEMYVQGVSTRKVAVVLEKLCGSDVFSTQVRRAANLLDEELAQWRSRPLGRTPYLILDTRYEKVRHQDEVVSCAVLTAIGISPTAAAAFAGRVSP